jgi:UDP:flavonoid glycosyltransferase YjiC (YdhE family)
MRILFCSFDSPGHLFPLVGLALELRRRGHQVAFASGPGACSVLDAAGIERIPRGRSDGDSFALPTWAVALKVAVDVKHVEHAVRRFLPDLLVAPQLCLAPLLVRERQGIPVAVMGLFSYLWPMRRAVNPERFAAREPTREWRLNDLARVANEARELFRMAPLDPGTADVPLRGDLFMLRTIPELEPELAALPAGVRLVGPCLWEPPHAPGAWSGLRARFADPDAPVLYVQQGRTFRSPGFWAQLVQALAGQPVQVVASTLRMDQPIGALPANFVAEPHVPQGLVMPHAQAAVSCGTTTAVLGALAHGLPSVLVPGGGESPDNTGKVLAAGCGVALKCDGLTPDVLHRAIADASADAGLRRSCRGVQAALARTDGFGTAAALVERLGSGTSSVRRARAPALAV